jgi:hypothetical protein
MVELYLHYSLRLDGIVLNCIVKYRNNFTFIGRHSSLADQSHGGSSFYPRSRTFSGYGIIVIGDSNLKVVS